LEEDLGPMLLADIRSIFASKEVDRIPSAELVKALHSLLDRPWLMGLTSGKSLNERTLSGTLRAFSIKSKTVRVGEKTKKGYMLEQFDDAFRRYLR
jgi:putative DNA primase/helicase